MRWRRQLRAQCFGRLMPGAMVHPSQKENEGRLGLALQCPQRRQIHPRAVGNLHDIIICHELRHSDQVIKSAIPVGQIDGLYARAPPLLVQLILREILRLSGVTWSTHQQWLKQHCGEHGTGEREGHQLPHAGCTGMT
jgi:hypothetical protein